MNNKPDSEVKCFICGRVVAEKDMEDVEMIKGPGFKNEKSLYYNKKLFVCVRHQGVSGQVKKETNENTNKI